MAEGISGLARGQISPLLNLLGLLPQLLPSQETVAPAGSVLGNLFGTGSGETVVPKNMPAANQVVPKGVQTGINNPEAPIETLADAIGPWETTVTPEEGVPATGEKTFGDKLSEALSGLGALESPGIQMPSTSDIASIARLVLGAAPPSQFLRLEEALPGRR